MIINPIIPIWLMSLISFIAIILILYNRQLWENTSNKKGKEKTNRQKNLIKKYIINSTIKISIIVVLFIINLRFMLPNGEAMTINSDTNILFVIDTSVSMKALDYDGNKERFEGVINDCCYIVDELSSCKFSIITFGDTAKRITPFTYDTDIIQAELRSIKLEDEVYAKGTSINIVKDVLEDTLKDEQKRQKENSETVIFFISDGEITKEGEVLESFSEFSKYISNGAILGYGTTSGGKMKSKTSSDPNSKFYYIYYYEDHKMTTAISKIDEKNLKKLASDFKIDYIQMSKTSNIDYKIGDIKQQIAESTSTEEKVTTYRDIYYYFAIPLVMLLIIDFINKKRRILWKERY